MENAKALFALPYLSECVNEALGLLPAIPTAVSKTVPAEGMKLGNIFIPGGTKICALRYSIG